MKPLTLAPSGGPVDCAWRNGRIVVTWQDGAGTGVRLLVREYDGSDLRVLSSMTHPLGDDVGAFPRLLSAAGSLWLIYREGKSLGGRAVLRKNGVEVWRSPGECGGNDPCCLGTWVEDGVSMSAAYWQRSGDNQVLGVFLPVNMGTITGGIGRPTGLSHIDANGDYVLVDDARGAVPGVTRPSWAGTLVVGEHPDTGALVRHTDGRTLRLWDGEQAFTPRLAYDAPTGRYAAVTWGKQGVRVAVFTESDLTVPPPPPDIAPWPPSGKGWTRRNDITEIDMVSYWLGDRDWSRNGMHVASDAVTYTHAFQSRTGAGWVQHTKFGPPDTRSATWTFTDRWIGLAFDGTNELAQGYRFVLPSTTQTAALYPRVMPVGEQHRRVVELDIVDRANPNDPPRRVRWAGWIAAMWQNDAPIGDLPAGTMHAEVMFEPAFGENSGWRERNFCAEHIGCWYWDRHRKTPNAVPDMRWVGTKNAPRFTDIPVQFADAVPVEATPTDPDPDPEPEPMPTIITDPEAANAQGRIEHHYEKYAEQVNYQKREVYTNVLSGVWMLRYNSHRQRGEPHEPAILAIEREMAVAAGIEEPDEPVPPVDPVEPTSTRKGSLRVDDKAYADANGRRLPFYIHAGDLPSRYSRDPDGARRMLDQIVTLKADGGRFWTWLLGDPHWRGRMFRGDWTVLRAFVNECKQRNLRLVLSQGDLWMAGESTARAWLSELAGFIRSEGPEWFDFVDGANEGRNTGQPDPAVIASSMRPLAGVGPILSLTDVPEGGPFKNDEEMLAHVARWAVPPAMVLDHHPQFSDPDGCIRRSWNAGYDPRSILWLWINSEPRGWGENVTVCNTIDRSAQLAMAAATWISGGAYVAMSSPGVISDGTKNGRFTAGESFLDMPGFRDLSALRAWLPPDVMTWRRVHGGDRPGSIRVWAVEDGNDLCRADHAINEATGEYVAVLSAGRCTQVRAGTAEDFDPNLGGGRRIVKGRV